MKHFGFQKLFSHRTRRNTFIQYFLSYFILFSVLLLGFYFILRNQVSDFYFEKLQNQARAERRAEKAAQEKKEFLEKLARAEASQTELDGKAMKVKGSEDAVQRDQLIGLMTAGF